MSITFRRLIAFAAYTAILAAWTTAPSAQPSEEYVLTSDDVQIFYRMLGAGRDTVVVLHGGPGFDMGYLAPDLEPLAESHVLIFYDQRGAGRSTLVSDTDAVSMSRHLADLEAVRRHFRLDRMTLLGHSWGAMLAARYALAYPDHVARLVFVSPGPLRRTPYMQQLVPNVTAWMDSTRLAEIETLRAARQDTTLDARATCRAFWNLFARGYFADPDSTMHRMRGDFCSAPGAAIRNGAMAGRLTWASIGEWDWREDFYAVRTPALVIAGTRDIFPVESAREWEAAFPNARVALLEAAGHYPHVERPDEFFQTLEAFLH